MIPDKLKWYVILALAPWLVFSGVALPSNNMNYGIYLTSRSNGNNITCNNIVTNGELQTGSSYRGQHYYSYHNVT